MSLVLRHAGSLKPEIRLAQAVSEFEATLTPEEKSSFQASRARAVSIAPTMSDVMRLTAEIDLKATSKHGRGRCFGPRMTNTLQAIQQFAALGDIIVGGGQNLIACGVWAAARMTLHVITGYFTYLENLSLLFMAIGRNAPRYQAMASLYPKSKSLQRYLCEYFIVITKLCHQSVAWTKKPALSRLSSTISDPQLKAFKDDLDVWSSAIKEEVNVLLNQAVAEEAKQNSLFRSLAKSRADTSAHQRKVERQIRYLDACSEYDYRSTWKQKRKCGTTRITTTCRQYQEWKGTFEETTILFLGKLGAGKSVLLANVVDDLNLDLNLQNNATTLYFFSRHDSEESMRARTILGCLIRQLLEYLMDDKEFDHLFPETISRLDVDDLVGLFKLAKPEDKAVFIVLDGLDECEMEVQRMVLQHLTVIRAFGYKLCLSVRTSELGPLWDTRSFHHRVFIPEMNPDISDFVNAEVDSRVRLGSLVTHDPDLAEEVKNELIARASGMFLWVTLQLDSICGEVSDHDIREAIQNLPRDLTETFQRNLAKASLKDYKRHHVRIFKLLVSAKELMTTEQLRQAVSVTIGQTVWNPAKEINTIYPILRFCGSLVMVDEEDETVRFIHHSARNFCLENPNHVTNWTFSELQANQHMAETLVTYLSYSLFETTVSRCDRSLIAGKEIPKEVARNALSSYHLGRNLAERIFNSTSRLKGDIGPSITRASTDRSEGVDRFSFLIYAKRYWLQHTANLEELPLLPQWHSLLGKTSFGINHSHLPIALADLNPIPAPGERLRKEPIYIPGGRFRQEPIHVPGETFRRESDDVLELEPEMIVLPDPSTIPSTKFLTRFTLNPRTLQDDFSMKTILPCYRNLYWALSNGHILTLRYELTSPRGFQRIRNYVILWATLKYVALTKPSIIQVELSYDLVRWLSPMFVDLLMDHPAKHYFLRRILTSDNCYKTLVRSAVKNVDLVAINALVRDDYEYQTVSLCLGWDNELNDVPPILEAALLKPFDKARVQEIIHTNDLWLFDLTTWLLQTHHQWYHFSAVLDSLQQAGVRLCEIELLQRVLSTGDQFVEVEGDLEDGSASDKVMNDFVLGKGKLAIESRRTHGSGIAR